MTARLPAWLLTAALCAAPLLLEGYALALATTTVIYALFALGLQWLVGGAGLISLGHAASFGIGAYAATLLASGVGHTQVLWLWPAGVLAAALFAAVTGALALRTRGLYFLMTTLAFSQMAYYIVHDARWSGGSDGLYMHQRPAIHLPGQVWPLDDPVAYYVACLLCLLLAWALLARLARTRWGRLLDAMRQDEVRLRACGADPTLPALGAYVLAGALGGLAGALHAGQDGYITPSLLSWEQSGLVLLMVVLGGSRHRWGAIAGAITVLLLQEAAQLLAARWQWEAHWQLGYGLALIALVLALPQGLASLVRPRRTRPAPLQPAADPSTAPLPAADTPHRPHRPSANSTVTLSAEGLTRRFGGLLAVSGVSLQLHAGTLHALIGPNGAGKSTLLHLLAGDLSADQGSLRLNGRDISAWPVHRRARAGLCRSDQHARLFDQLSVADNVQLAAEACHPRARPQRIQRLARLALARTGLTDQANRPASALSHGARKRLNMALCLATRPRCLLLDEPLAGLGPDEAALMRACIAALRRHAILLVEHDMDAVFGLADQITVLVDGRIIASGPPTAIRADPTVQRAYLGD